MRARIGVLGLIAAMTAANGQEAAPACTNAGISYKVGELACIAACHGRRRLAKCEVVADAAAWIHVSDACPSAMMLISPWPAGWSVTPAVTAMSPVPLEVNSSAIALAVAPRALRRGG